MFYQPAHVGMGDQWLYYHDGVHYLYHLYEQPAGQLYGVYLATSTDGVHFTEVGPVIEKKADAAWLGSGSVWQAGGKYMMNFSESRGGVQSISFAESTDLIHWQRLGDEYTSHPDPRWYEVGRWDCIWAMPRKEGGFWGYLSANPTGLTYRSTGMVESADGIKWQAVAPPVFEWGTTPQMVWAEVGAVTMHNNKYYMIVQTWDAPYGFGAYTFIGDTPQGPFRPDTGAFCLLGNKQYRTTHFPRFYSTPDELLVNHFFFTRSMSVWLAPLKKAVFDDQGHLRLNYWKGNDVVKGKPIPVDLAPSGVAGQLTVDGSGAFAASLLANTFDLEKGFVLEGTLKLQPSGAASCRGGLYLEEIAGQGTTVLLGTNGQTELGELKTAGAVSFVPNDFVQAGITGGQPHTFRLLTRKYMMEFYLDDRLIHSYSIPERGTGRLGFVVQGGLAVVGNLKAWEMNFIGPDSVRTEHAARGKPVSLANPYHATYPAGGDGALTDGKRGRLGSPLSRNWQGFAAVDLDATIDLGQVTTIHSLESTCLQYISAGIYFPTSVKYLVSVDGSKFDEVATIAGAAVPLLKPDSVIRPFAATLAGVPARYVRVQAANIHTIPAGYPAAGAEGWLFVDEIMVNAFKETK